MRNHPTNSSLSVLAAITLFFAISQTVMAGPEEMIILEAGIGMRGYLEIGRTPRIDGAELERISKQFGLQYQQNPSGAVTAISCTSRGCLTSRNVGIQSSTAQIYQRYGNPIDVQSTRNGKILEYSGVAFEIDNSPDKIVRRVVIYPKY